MMVQHLKPSLHALYVHLFHTSQHSSLKTPIAAVQGILKGITLSLLNKPSDYVIQITLIVKGIRHVILNQKILQFYTITLEDFIKN